MTYHCLALDAISKALELIFDTLASHNSCMFNIIPDSTFHDPLSTLTRPNSELQSHCMPGSHWYHKIIILIQHRCIQAPNNIILFKKLTCYMGLIPPCFISMLLANTTTTQKITWVQKMG